MSLGNSVHAPNLPLELIEEILARLPVKHLSQLRCLCKSWNSLISNPEFAKKHLRRSSTQFLISSIVNPFNFRACPLVLPFNTFSNSTMQLQYPLKNQIFDSLVGSCDGILCFHHGEDDALLWNPSIGKFKKLPSLKSHNMQGGNYTFTVYGFGYDHFSDSYKVVAVVCDVFRGGGTGTYKTQVNVYTVGTNSWRRIRDFPPGARLDIQSGKFVSGTINWLRYAHPCSLSVIVSLDLGNESFQEILQPDYGGRAVLTLKLCVLRDCLCILSHLGTFTDVWIMKEYGNRESWIRLFSVPYPYRGTPGVNPCPNAYYIFEDDEVLLEYPSKLLVYNSRNGTFKSPEIQKMNGRIESEVYVESLISPCS